MADAIFFSLSFSHSLCIFESTITVNNNRDTMDNFKLSSIHWRRSIPCTDNRQLAHNISSIQIVDQHKNGRPFGVGFNARRSLA